MKIKLNNVRLSFPSIFYKAKYGGEETKYEATFLLDKDTHAEKIEEINEAIKSMIKTELKVQKLGAEKICFKDGDEIGYDGYDNTMSFKASSSKRPLAFDRDKTPLTDDDNRLYAGCYVNAIVELWAQNHPTYGKRINANLHGVQFWKDGKPFGSGASVSADDFDAFDDDEQADFM